MFNQHSQRPATPFPHVRRYWDQHRHINIAKIGPGELYVSDEHELISTLLGSCVAVCMRDPINRVGGMNHFKLPKPGGDINSHELNANYGSYAMELLINQILKKGGEKRHLECKIYGGGNVLPNISSNIGAQNIDFVMRYLEAEDIPVRRQVTGSDRPQQVYYHPITGSAFSILQGHNTLAEVKHAEQAYLSHIQQSLAKEDVTYF